MSPLYLSPLGVSREAAVADPAAGATAPPSTTAPWPAPATLAAAAIAVPLSSLCWQPTILPVPVVAALRLLTQQVGCVPVDELSELPVDGGCWVHRVTAILAVSDVVKQGCRVNDTDLVNVVAEGKTSQIHPGLSQARLQVRRKVRIPPVGKVCRIVAAAMENVP